MGYIHPPQPRFTYFDRQLKHPDWASKKVLDFGGNSGNLLREPGSTVSPCLYWCLDVDKTPLDQGRMDFPEAHWVYYNRHNPCYNPLGTKGEPLPKFDTTFDIVTAYSVFTHMPEREALELITQLTSLLSPGGQFIFTFAEPLAIRTFLKRRIDDGAMLDLPQIAEWIRGKEKFAMIDDGHLESQATEIEECRHYLAFYSVGYMLKILQDMNPAYRPPIYPDIQSSLIITNGMR